MIIIESGGVCFRVELLYGVIHRFFDGGGKGVLDVSNAFLHCCHFRIDDGVGGGDVLYVEFEMHVF